LGRATVVQIFNGQITRWNDPTILEDNPDVADLLPDQPITLVVREDSSGTTSIFMSCVQSFSQTSGAEWKYP
jgi:phosphate transport system substrate-binding protein